MWIVILILVFFAGYFLGFFTLALLTANKHSEDRIPYKVEPPPK